METPRWASAGGMPEGPVPLGGGLLPLSILFFFIDHKSRMTGERFVEIAAEAKRQFDWIAEAQEVEGFASGRWLLADSAHLGPLGRMTSVVATERGKKGDSLAVECESAIWGGYGDAVRVGFANGRGRVSDADASAWVATAAWLAAHRSRALFAPLNPLRHLLRSGTFYRLLTAGVARGLLVSSTAARRT